MIRKLKIKFVLTVMGLITLLLALMLSFFYIRTSRTLHNESMAAMKDYASTQPGLIYFDRFGKIFGSGGDKYSHLNMFVIEYYRMSDVIIPYGFEKTLTDEQKNYIVYIVDTALNSTENDGIIEKYNLRYLKTNITGGVRIVFLDKAYEDNTLHGILLTIILIGCGGFICFFIITLIISKIAIAPVEKSITEQKQLVADISHELKTPIAIISANTEIISSKPDAKVADLEKWLGFIKSETNRMSDLIAGMLYLAKTDEAAESYQKTNLDFSSLVLGTILPFESVCFEKQLTLKTNIQPDININGNKELLVRLVGILTDNAIKYSDPAKGGVVGIDLYRVQDKIILAVNNKGEVISPKTAKHIFTRFYRPDESRSRTDGGYGLGLAIAKSIVDIHGGKITLESNETDGTTFIVSFKAS
jgi:two-component system sensor histidine kinase CiaH